MEACAGAHYWANKLAESGHTVKLIAPQFVKPYVKANKTDAADAEAICEAVTRPTMRFVPKKSVDQQAVLSLHRARQGFIRAGTAQANQLRGLLGEYGIVLPNGVSHVAKRLPDSIEDAENDLPDSFRDLLYRLRKHLVALYRHVQEVDEQINQWHLTNPASRRLEQIPGVGPLTASALVASVGDGHCFKNGRELAAWLGLVPRQHSGGGRVLMQGISKRGDSYLRMLMVHGARAAMRVCDHNDSSTDTWSTRMLRRRHPNVAIVARANKNGRVVWALRATIRCSA